MTQAASPRALISFGSTGQPARRLYCLPFAGGGPATYRTWPRSLPDDVEVTSVVLPGRDPRDRLAGGPPPAGEMAELLPPIVAAVVDAQRTSPLPYAVFGHSMGALVAFELVVALEAASRTEPSLAPELLVVSGRRSPDEVHRGDRIHDLPDAEFLDEMQRRYGGVPDAVRNEPDLLALFLPGLRADVSVFETYAPLTARRVACPVAVCGGADDPRPRPDTLHGWQRQAHGEITVRVFPGGHFYLHDQRDALGAHIESAWRSATRRHQHRGAGGP